MVDPYLVSNKIINHDDVYLGFPFWKYNVRKLSLVKIS